MVMLPNVTDSAESAATSALLAMDIDSPNVVVQAASSPRAAGTVLRQEPAGGARVLGTEDTVTLHVAGTKVAVPGVHGLPQLAAVQKVAAAGLKVLAVPDWNVDAPQGTVFRTVPDSGSRANRGDTVSAYVSAPGGWAYLDSPPHFTTGQRARGNCASCG